ncbi:MAG: EAL domain-containing protein [Candidatus Nanopelagicales bacterium]
MSPDPAAAWAVLASSPAPGMLLAAEPGGVRMSPNPAAVDLLGARAVDALSSCADVDAADLLRRARDGGQPAGTAVLRDPDGSVVATVRYDVVGVDTDHAVCWLRRETEPAVRRARGAGEDRARAGPGRVTAGPPDDDGELAAEVRRAVGRAREGASFALALLEFAVAPGDPTVVTRTETGDLAAEVAALLRTVVRDRDRVVDAGPGLVALLAEGLSDADAIGVFLDRLRAETVPRLSERAGGARVCIGVVVSPADDADTVLRDAAAALAEARTSAHPGGPAVTVVYDEAEAAGALAPITSADLVEAIDSGELLLHYQPVVDVTDWRCGGAEALLRWRHPKRGLLAPPEFLGRLHADASDRLVAWVVDEAARQVAVWERVADLDYFRVGLNVSPWELVETDLVGTVAAALRRHGVSGQRFALEILETEDLAGRGRAAAQVRALRDLGLRVAIDDFGSGFATMSYLHDLPVDLVKVDRTLVSLHPGRRDEAILAALASVADAIGADVVLEGVEHPDQVALARRVGVRFAQGLLLGAPAPASPTRLPAPEPEPPGLR